MRRAHVTILATLLLFAFGLTAMAAESDPGKVEKKAPASQVTATIKTTKVVIRDALKFLSCS